MYFDRFSERARRAIFFAHRYAMHSHARAIEPAHLLLGLLREDPELFALVAHGQTSPVDALMEVVGKGESCGDGGTDPAALPLSRTSRKIIRLANQVGAECKQNQTGTSHLLYALTDSSPNRRAWFRRRNVKSDVSKILARHGVTPDAVEATFAKGHATQQTRDTKA